jgi:hypothetical protein
MRSYLRARLTVMGGARWPSSTAPCPDVPVSSTFAIVLAVGVPNYVPDLERLTGRWRTPSTPTAS